MATQKRFDSIEEIASWLTDNPYNATRRWTLQKRNEQEYINKEAGAAWEEKYHALWSDDSLQGDAKWDAQRELYKSRPEQVSFMTYSLKEADGSTYHSTYYYLGRELGEQIASVWKIKTDRYGYSDFTGCVTLTTILKRLGDTAIGQQVKDAQAQAKATSERNNRNYARERARKLAAELLEIIKYNADITFPTQLSEIAVMENEVA